MLLCLQQLPNHVRIQLDAGYPDIIWMKKIPPNLAPCRLAAASWICVCEARRRRETHPHLRYDTSSLSRLRPSTPPPLRLSVLCCQ